jgi:hypothetical protein
MTKGQRLESVQIAILLRQITSLKRMKKPSQNL